MLCPREARLVRRSAGERRGWALALAITLAVVGERALARADAPPDTASLGWSRLPGAEGCATSIELGERMEAILGHRVLVAAPEASMAIEGRIEPSGAGFRATIVVSRRGGEREGERVFSHEGPDCRDATEPLALVLALLVDPEASPLERREAPHPLASRAQRSPSVPTSIDDASDPHDAPRLVLDLGAGVSLLATPFVAPVGRITLHLVFPGLRAFPLAIIATGWTAPFSRAEAPDGGALDLLLAAGGLGVCWMPRIEAWLEGSICLLADVGAALVVGTRALVPDERERVLVFGDVLFALRARLAEAWTAHLALSLLGVGRQEPWTAMGETRFRPEPLGVLVTLGLGFDVGIGR